MKRLGCTSPIISTVLLALLLPGCVDPSDTPTEALSTGKRTPSLTKPPLPPPPYTYMKFGQWGIPHKVGSPTHEYPSTFDAPNYYYAASFPAPDAMPYAEETWNDMNASEYTTRYLPLRDDYLYSSPPNWDGIDAEIEFAAQKGADWVYVDDIMTRVWTPGREISEPVFKEVCRRIHAKNRFNNLAGPRLQVAVADRGHPEEAGIEELLAGQPHFLDSIDVFMPYHYSANYSALQWYFNWVEQNIRYRIPGKQIQIAPILGYNVIIGAPPDQLGAQSGDAAFIELAYQSSSLNWDQRARIIFYNVEPDNWTIPFDSPGGRHQYIWTLTFYLSDYGYLPPLD